MKPKKEQFFHGTSEKLKRGSLVVSGISLGKPAYYDNDRAHATTDPEYARSIAEIKAVKSKTKPRVYVVSPLKGDESFKINGRKASSEKGFKVLREHK